MKKTMLSRVARRKKRVSSNMWGTKERPRIVVYRSNKYIYAQAIDDESRTTIVSLSSYHVSDKNKTKMKKTEGAKRVGVELAQKLIEKNIKTGIFDRSYYTYLGRVQQLAEGLREGGLKI